MSTYRDFSLDFSTHPITGDLVMKNDVSAVLQAIKNLIQTNVGEFLWEPNMGGGLNKVMFEQNDNMLKMMLFDRLTQVINRHEPRVELVDVNISKMANGHGINISLTFYILNNPEPITETIPIRRIR